VGPTARPRRAGAAAALALALAAAGPAVGQGEGPEAEALEAGLRRLVALQEPDGSYQAPIGYKMNDSYVGADGPHVGVTALAGLALVRSGADGPGGEARRRALDGCVAFVLSSTRANGLITAGGTRMYSHGYATWLLAEVQRAAPDEAVALALERAVGLTAAAQTEVGGWRYLPGTVAADSTNTAVQLQALLAARAAGAPVPDATVAGAVDYLRSCDGPGGEARPAGFGYEHGETVFAPTRVTFSTQGAAAAALAAAGLDPEAAPELTRALAFLLDPQNRAAPASMPGSLDYFFGHHHGLLAIRALAPPEDARAWSRSIAAELAASQGTDGGWEDLIGEAHATATACLILLEAREVLAGGD